MTDLSQFPTSLEVVGSASMSNVDPAQRSSRQSDLHTPRSELDVVVALHDIHVQLAVRRCLEDALIDTELGDTDRHIAL